MLSTQTAAAASLDTWEKVAQCESGNDWSISTGNGFFGGLQFTASTWAEFGGLTYGANAHLATKEQQIEIAEKVLAKQGPNAWPICSIKAGLQATSAYSSVVRGTLPEEKSMGSVQSFTSSTGDTLSSIAAALEIRWEELYEASGGRVTADPSAPLPAGTVVNYTMKPPSSIESRAASPSIPKSVSIAKPGATSPIDSGAITTPYGQPGSWAKGYHTGVDFAIPIGTPVRAVRDGVVISSSWQGAYGNAVVIRHDDGIYTLSAHLSTLGVAAGQRVSAGDQIGLSGSTGNSTGPHLHLEVRTGTTYGSDINPVSYLQQFGVSI
ncbi:peptidoglycan DD-metalloendopeptidase family protein [Streptomyces sp. NPDC088748]|uniref:peptidoglycan DD-metalloendopeptidase family protein n=1 Tax=Streptomyces sp. NPDC088748 TaxID=3365887 RepID=UPI003828084F